MHDFPVQRFFIWPYISEYALTCICTVEGSKCFVCNKCKREYKTTKSLKRHEKERHTDKRVYVCTVKSCKATFLRKGYATRHLIRKHGLEKTLAKALVKTWKKQDQNLENYYEPISEDEEFLNG